MAVERVRYHFSLAQLYLFCFICVNIYTYAFKFF